MTRRDRGLTAVELMVVIVVIGIAAAVTVPALVRGGRNDRLAKCEWNLRTLGEADVASQAIDPPQSRGSAYWAEVAAGTKLKPELLICPLSQTARYRGPTVDPAKLPPTAPIGADAVGSHGKGEGGTVLLKTGEVRAVREESGFWQDAATILGP